MFCDACGAKLEEGQNFCRSCGKQVGAAPAARAHAGLRVAAHLRVMAVLWIAVAVIRVIPVVFLFSLSHWQLPPDVPAEVQGFLHPLFRLIGWFLLLSAAAGFVAAWGLLERAPWARLYTIILAALSLIDIPLGTALGIYSLWVLIPESSEAEYRQLSSQPL